MTKIFYATRRDLATIYRWLCAIDGLELYECRSQPNEQLRQLKDGDEIEAFLLEGNAPPAIWPRWVGGKLEIERNRLNRQSWFQLRGPLALAPSGPSIVRIFSNSDQNACLADSQIITWSEKGARQRSIFDDNALSSINWKAHRAFVGKLGRQIASLSPAKLRSYPIMPDAFTRLDAGMLNLWDVDQPCTATSPLITKP